MTNCDRAGIHCTGYSYYPRTCWVHGDKGLDRFFNEDNDWVEIHNPYPSRPLDTTISSGGGLVGENRVGGVCVAVGGAQSGDILENIKKAIEDAAQNPNSNRFQGQVNAQFAALRELAATGDPDALEGLAALGLSLNK